jgi:hypothetical protein
VYFGVFLAVCGKTAPSHLLNDEILTGSRGIYPAFPGNVTWIANNLAGGYKRAAGMAIHIGVGNLAGGMSFHAPYALTKN